MAKFTDSEGYKIIQSWMDAKGQQPFPFQTKTWRAIAQQESGLVIAPTGFGKTFSVFLGIIVEYLSHPKKFKKGLKILWISPLRSLSKDLQRAMQEVIDEIGLDWEVASRNGDTPTKERQRQRRNMPDVMITTPETLHLLFTYKNNAKFFTNLNCVVIDEWHELLGNKRGILTELAIARLNQINPKLLIWGITATIGNLDEALEVLIPYQKKKRIVQSKIKKKIKIESVIPDEIETLPWAGHLGLSMASKIAPIIEKSKTTLVFTNTRSQSEMWYQILLNTNPDLAGTIAIHHGSIDRELRLWIEDAIGYAKLKAVICTSSLDLGVDFKPVDTVIQIGSVKGVARFLQRAGRSGHSPFETSKIYFVPTHTLELVEVAALKEAAKINDVEKREPLIMSFDVLVQFLVTLALGEGFKEEETKAMITETHAFSILNDDEWKWAMQFITQGGAALKNYPEFHKVEKSEEGLFKVQNKRIAMLHRMNVGVIVSDVMMKVKFRGGGYLGMVEEYFVSKLNPGEKFVLAGRVLELQQTKDLTAYVKMSKGKAITPSWLGGRLPLSSHLGSYLRKKMNDALSPSSQEKELKALHPLMISQEENSHIPTEHEFLVEMISTREGHHLFMYPFEGRLVHEAMAALIAYRISQIQPMTFTMAMNDYGFELLSDQPIPVDDDILFKLLSKNWLMQDMAASVNATEMASRKFRDIAVIAGLVMQNQPGSRKNFKSLQSSSKLIFQVLEEHEPHNLLVRQAYQEVFDQQFEETRLKNAFNRIAQSKIILKYANSFTPLSFPIKVDSLRASLSSEDLVSRVKKMQKAARKKSRKKPRKKPNRKIDKK